jgi:DUF1707 SHOCT-like domain
MAAAGDAQRERAVEILKRAYADGRLELEDFTSRAQWALAARSTWELRLCLRGLLADDVRRRAKRALRIALAVVLWLFLSVFLGAACIVALVATSAAAWTLAFPAAWLVLTVLAVREVRRAD